MNSPFKNLPDSPLCAVHQAALRRAGKSAVRVLSTIRTVKLLAFGLGLATMGLSSARANTLLGVPIGTTDLTTLGATSTSDLTFTNTNVRPDHVYSRLDRIRWHGGDCGVDHWDAQ